MVLQFDLVTHDLPNTRGFTRKDVSSTHSHEAGEAVCRALAPHLTRAYAKDVKFGADARALMLQGVDCWPTLWPSPWAQRVVPSSSSRAGAALRTSTRTSCQAGAGCGQQHNEEAGDGTTTATVLARAIAKEGFDHQQRSHTRGDPRGVMMAVETIINELKKLSKPVTNPEEIARCYNLCQRRRGDRKHHL
ncbi:hypothetical protein INR49_009521 [Caranx melampygus]|nr:hypothetical protein INR49_009521 [Caranx melampygus]